eukprot:7875383-Alexandrium_andersonii.AAC.1
MCIRDSSRRRGAPSRARSPLRWARPPTPSSPRLEPEAAREKRRLQLRGLLSAGTRASPWTRGGDR